MSPMPIRREIHTAFWGFSPSFGICVRVRAPPAAANSSNGRRRQTTCGKSFSNRRERKRGRSGAFENEPPPRSVNRKGGRVSLVSCVVTWSSCKMQILRIPPPNPNGSLSRPTERQAALSFAAQRSKGPPPLTPSLPLSNLTAAPPSALLPLFRLRT